MGETVSRLIYDCCSDEMPDGDYINQLKRVTLGLDIEYGDGKLFINSSIG